MDQLLELIKKWHHDRGITVNGSAITQTVKLSEEMGELAAGIIRNDRPEVIDALGDMIVVMVSIAELNGFSLEEAVRSAYNEIKDRKGFLNEHGNFVKEGDTVFKKGDFNDGRIG